MTKEMLNREPDHGARGGARGRGAGAGDLHGPRATSARRTRPSSPSASRSSRGADDRRFSRSGTSTLALARASAGPTAAESLEADQRAARSSSSGWRGASLLRACVPAALRRPARARRAARPVRAARRARLSLVARRHDVRDAGPRQLPGDARRQRRAEARRSCRAWPAVSICAFALTEPEAGSDVSAIATRAVRDGDGWRPRRREVLHLQRRRRRLVRGVRAHLRRSPPRPQRLSRRRATPLV